MQKILENGLILRSLDEGHENDRETLAEFYMRVFGEAEPGDEDVQTFDKWTHDLLHTNPVMALENFFVVVDPAHDEKIVSALMLIPQTWTYAGIEFGMGRVELVATEKDYRRRGLVRELMDAAHERSADLGHLVQGITGIPYFYRQFGYTMAVDNLGSRCIVQFSSFAPLKDDKQPDFTLRDATPDDIPALMVMDEFAESQYLMTVRRDAAMWEFEIVGRHETPYFLTGDVQMIINQDDMPVGYVML
ncbi:MAG: GNAT family N-acetyltransferase, partial [Aggregatilineales bacterium]